MLLDANVIIEAFRLGIWDTLVSNSELAVASSIVEEAGHTYATDTGQRITINLQPYILSGAISVESGNVTRMAEVVRTCERHMELHRGEVESMAVVIEKGVRFCTADHAAAKAMVLLDAGHLALSFEELLKRHGATPKLAPRRQFSKAEMTKWLKEGGILRVQTFGKKS